jgi:4a-hydroxytetrahydrobiopterin dehydratase
MPTLIFNVFIQMNLTNKKCIPCEVGGLPIDGKQIVSYMKDLPQWKVSADQKKIMRSFKFADFKESLAFVNKVGALAEREGHHPDVSIHYNEVSIELLTHAVGGLSENDFIVAAKINLVK